jgi:hypothetical protein
MFSSYMRAPLAGLLALAAGSSAVEAQTQSTEPHWNQPFLVSLSLRIALPTALQT